MQTERSPTITRRALVQRAAIVVGSLVTVACGARTMPSTPAAVTLSPAPAIQTTPTVPPTPSPPVIFDQTLVVNGRSPNADDTNQGTDDRPLKTIAKAAERAVQSNLRNISTRIVIAPGTYRESLSLQANAGLSAAPMQFEAKQSGTVTIAGSDVWTGWQKRGANMYAHAWPYKWGLAPYPDGWQGNVVLAPIVRRREMIFINGRALTQVLSQSELKEGTFFVAEAMSTVFLVPPTGIAVENATIEVAIRSGLFLAESARNLTMRGLVFMHDTTPVGGTAVVFNNCSNILVEDCGFFWNNWSGMTFNSTASRFSQSVTARRTTANYNGAVGLEASRVKDLLYEDNETSYNNWRGAQGQYYSWEAGGMKHLFIHGGTYRRHRAIGNQAAACWFDTDCANIVVERAFCSHNYIGLFVEASQGPTSIADCTICHSGLDGVQTEGGANVTLQGNIIYDSAGANIRVLKGVRPVTNWETKADMKLVAERWTLRKNIIVGTDAAPRLARIGNSSGANNDRFLSTLVSDENVWFSPKSSEAFDLDQKSSNFTAWQSASGQDAHSRFIDPQFVNPDNDDFSLRDTSPLRNG